jgi:signal transduction histidine kinase
VQEFINNSIKHGNAKKIIVRMNATVVPGNVSVILQDNGKGFEIKKMNGYTGMGLKNMKSRVESYNGTLKIDSVLDFGTKYEMLIPYNNGIK